MACIAEIEDPTDPDAEAVRHDSQQDTQARDRLQQVLERAGIALPLEGAADARKVCEALGVEKRAEAEVLADLRELARLLPLGQANRQVEDALLLQDLVKTSAAAGRDRSAVVDDLQSLHASHGRFWKASWQKDLYLLVDRETAAGRERGPVLAQFDRLWDLTQRGEPVATAVRMYDMVEAQARAGRSRDDVYQEMERITQLPGEDSHADRVVRLFPLIEDQVAQGVERDQVFLLYQWIQDMCGLEEFEGQALDRFGSLCDLSKQSGVGLDRLVRDAEARLHGFQAEDDPLGKAVELTSFVEGQVKAGHSRESVMEHVATCNVLGRDPCVVPVDPPAGAPSARPSVEQGTEFVTIAGVKVPVRRPAHPFR